MPQILASSHKISNTSLGQLLQKMTYISGTLQNYPTKFTLGPTKQACLAPYLLTCQE
ncbi:uncharacterized protein G2W53_040634 [Senna tora]|uniref:Uncharacterized protein n=1 Tax=Senna tora TaxID=362788 RepID=A0A834SFY0_9FABA|nr:uncharacterized protein G2W53_040634 [Senna tora]